MKGKEEGHQALQAFDGLATAQVAISHLRAIAFTLITKVAAVVLIAGSWGARQQSTFSEPTQQARLVAAEIGPLVARGNDSTDLNVVLRLLVSGDINAPIVPFWTPPAVSARSGNAFSDVAYVVVGPDGQPVASSPRPKTTPKPRCARNASSSPTSPTSYAPRSR